MGVDAAGCSSTNILVAIDEIQFCLFEICIEEAEHAGDCQLPETGDKIAREVTHLQSSVDKMDPWGMPTTCL